MQIQVTTRHGEIERDQRDYMQTKSERLLHYFERVTSIEVLVDFGVDHKIKVEMQVDAEHRHDFVASETDYELIPTFDKTLHKMEQQIRRYKEKIQDHRNDPRSSDVVLSELEAAEAAETPDESATDA